MIHRTGLRGICSYGLALVGVLALSGCGGGSDDTPPQRDIGGTVSGLSGTVVLQLNGANDLTVNSDGSFSFDTQIEEGNDYTVTVLTHPTAQGCEVSNGSGTATADVNDISVECIDNVDASGYYINTGTLTISDGMGGQTSANDFQAIVHANRLMAMSTSEGLIYDATVDVNGEEFTATATVYRDGLLVEADIPLSGMIVEDSSISGNLEGTSDEGQGSFTLTFSNTNTGEADIARIKTIDANTDWVSPVSGSTSDMRLNVLDNADDTGLLGTATPRVSDGNMAGCSVRGVTPPGLQVISGTRFYAVSVDVRSCDVRGQDSGNGTGPYTGFATTRTAADQVLVFITASSPSSNGQFAIGADFSLEPDL